MYSKAKEKEALVESKGRGRMVAGPAQVGAGGSTEGVTSALQHIISTNVEND